MNLYKVIVKPPAQKDILKLNPEIAYRIFKALKLLEINPRPPGCLKLTTKEGYRIRVGAYRILYEINDSKKTLIIYRVKHRREVYK